MLIYLHLEMAAFELNVRAYTPWADAFTLDEWTAFGYIFDLAYYYCFGYEPTLQDFRALLITAQTG